MAEVADSTGPSAPTLTEIDFGAAEEVMNGLNVG